jgi:hypothetical protein
MFTTHASRVVSAYEAAACDDARLERSLMVADSQRRTIGDAYEGDDGIDGPPGSAGARAQRSRRVYRPIVLAR